MALWQITVPRDHFIGNFVSQVFELDKCQGATLPLLRAGAYNRRKGNWQQGYMETVEGW